MKLLIVVALVMVAKNCHGNNKVISNLLNITQLKEKSVYQFCKSNITL